MKLTRTALIAPLLFSIFLAASTSTFAQQQATPTSKPKTDLESFQEKFGSVIIKGYSEVGSLLVRGKKLTFSAREVRDAVTNTKVKGLVVEIDSQERFSSSKRSFVEYNEIASLLRGIEFISKIDNSVTSLSNFEASYQTKGDFGVTVFNSSGNILSVAVSVGSTGKETVFGDMTLLSKISELIQKAKDTLDNVK